MSALPRHTPLVALLVALAAPGAVQLAHAQGAAPKDEAKAAPGGASLTRAYKREFAFLEAETQALEKRIASLDAERPTRVAASKAEVEALQARTTALAMEADRLNEQLVEADRAVDATLEDQDALDNLLQQASVALTSAGKSLPEPADEAQASKARAVDGAFDAVLQVLDAYSSVRVESGKYFGMDGRQVEGPIVEVGRIARFGAAPAAAGTLVPAGSGEMKVWPSADSSETALALAGGKVPDLLRIFIYDNLDRPVEAKKEKTAQEIVASGGIIAYVIVGIGILALLLITTRFVTLSLLSRSGKGFLPEVAALTARRQIREALALAKQQGGPLGRVVHGVLNSLKRTREELEDVVAEAMLGEQPRIDRFGSTITVLAAVSPLLGLLGTVTGMISTFDVITEYGTGNPKMLSGGISEALVTTELGLIVAIPALLCGNMLASWAEAVKDDLEKGALHITNVATGVRTDSEAPSEAAPARPMASSAEVAAS